MEDAENPIQSSSEAFASEPLAPQIIPVLTNLPSANPSPPILVVDDSDEDIEVIKHALQRARVANPVQVVTSGADAISCLKGPDALQERALYPFPLLLLLDLKMPGISGFDVLVWLREHQRCRPKAVVVLAGVTALPDIQAAYRMGANSFLTKPLVVEDLLNTLRGLNGVQIASDPEGIRLYLP